VIEQTQPASSTGDITAKSMPESNAVYTSDQPWRFLDWGHLDGALPKSIWE